MFEQQLVPELYRNEYSKMVAVLCKRFGISFMDTALDIVSDTFLLAAETWGQKGLPANPPAWLHLVARNKAINEIKHQHHFKQQILGEISKNSEPSIETNFDLDAKGIADSQLQMIFAICHPVLPAEAQIAMALRVLCGFGIDEIAQALLTNKSNVNKRLYRAKEKLRAEKIEIAMPAETEISGRLDNVLLTLYLLFNEGYYSAGTHTVLRKECCTEAMRLTLLLTLHPQTANPGVFALLALMCFQASRFDARVNASGELILYEDQDSNLWNQELINRGDQFFVKATSPNGITRYHAEAAIAWWHTQQGNEAEKWENILQWYNQLLMIIYSPIAALNRAFAYARVYGKAGGIREAEQLQLNGHLFYHSLLGDLYSGIDDTKAATHLDMAIALAPTLPEKAVLKARRDKLHL